MNPLFESLRDVSCKQLLVLLEQMVQRSEQLLAGMADGLEEQEIERHFALADRLKVEGNKLVSAFSDHYQAAFAEVVTGKIKHQKKAARNLSFDNLAILDDYSMDEAVATKKVIAETRTQFLPILIGLKTRVDNLLGKHLATEDSNPLDPRQVAEIFIRCHGFIKQDSEDNILLFRLFNSCVLEKMGPILEAANQLLVENKVDSQLRADPRSKPQRRNYSASYTNNSELEAQLLENAQQQQSFSKLQQLMASSQSQTIQSGLSQLSNLAAQQIQDGSVGVGSFAPVATGGVQTSGVQIGQLNNKTEAIPTSQLIDTLTDLQKQSHDQSNLRQQLVDEIQKQSSNNALIEQNDADAINLVGMIFDTLHEDPELSDGLKKTIKKLQAPILKTALSDKDFFDNSAHPARRLLNELAKSTELDAESNGEVDQQLDNVISQLNQTPEQESELLEQALQDLELSNQKHSLKSEQTQQREIQKREQELTKQKPKQAASYTITQMLEEQKTPPAVRKLLEGGWQNFLTMIAKKQGTQSKAWRQAQRTAEVLIWSVQDHQEKEKLNKLEKMLPRLVGNVRKGLSLSRSDEFETNILLKQLSAIHLEVVKGNKPKWLEQNENQTQAQPDNIAAPELAALQQYEALPVGSWIEAEISGKIMRCKLAAYLKFVDKYVFVDRMGVKVLEQNDKELKAALQSGSIKHADNIGLFDKALNQVASNLQGEMT